MSELPQYHGARFYKCALQVNPFDYARQHGKESGAASEEEYNQGMLQACQSAGVEVVALANHGDVLQSEGLRQILRDSGITVFPGFEISSSEKIHMVCFFPAETPIQELEGFLGAASGDNAQAIRKDPTHASSLTCLSIAAQMKKFDGIWYAPHIEGKNGLLDGSFHEIWREHDLVRVGALTQHYEKVDSGIRTILSNEDPNYKRERPIVLINANDVKNLADLCKPRSACWIKMTEPPDIGSLRQAFFDTDSRILLSEPQDAAVSRIESIRWEGGEIFQDNAVRFSPNLNAVIGGRGTGKSSLLESIRYVLMRVPLADDSRILSQGIIRTNLAASKVVMRVWSHQRQKRYELSRRYGEDTQVKNAADGEISNLSAFDILPSVDILGQNEIIEISKDPRKVRELLERFLPNSMFADKIRQTTESLRENRIRLVQLEEELEKLEEVTSQENALKEQMRDMRQSGVEEKLGNLSHIAKERQFMEKLESTDADLASWLSDLDDISESFPALPDAAKKWPHYDAMADIRGVFAENLKKIADGRDAMRVVAEKLSENLLRQHQLLKEKWGQLNDELAQLAQQLPQHGAEPGGIFQEYKNLSSRWAHITRAADEKKKKTVALGIVRDRRRKLLDEYRQFHFARFRALGDAAKLLNEGTLSGKVQIKIERMGLRGDLKEFLRSNVSGVGESGVKWLDGVGGVDIVKMAECIRGNKTEEFRGIFSDNPPTAGTAGKIIKMSRAKTYELEEVAVEDGVVVSLNVAAPGNQPDYRPLDLLSTGQKCTALLELFLLNREYPLILDQPEDHLDNAFIASHIVRKIRQIKGRCQLILSTHNANIPVFGDAELIAVLETDENSKASIKDERLGSIDKPAVKEQVALILDGGREAFTMRREKYGY